MAPRCAAIFFHSVIILLHFRVDTQRRSAANCHKNPAELGACWPLFRLQHHNVICTQNSHAIIKRSSAILRSHLTKSNWLATYRRLWNISPQSTSTLLPETVRKQEFQAQCASSNELNYCPENSVNLEPISSHPPLLLVAHRGPVSLQDDGSTKRNAGGLITALTSLSSDRIIIWLALSQTSLEMECSKESTRSILTVTPKAQKIHFYPITAHPSALQMFYNVMCNTILWFVHHSLPIPESMEMTYNQTDAYESGYRAVNKNLADSVLQHVEEVSRPIILLQDYHAYLVPGLIRAARHDARLLHFIHIPWPTISFWSLVPTQPRLEILHSLLENDIIGFHTTTYCQRFLQCCSYFLGLDVDENRGVVRVDGKREVWVRPYPAPINANITLDAAHSPIALQHVFELQQTTPELLVVLVARSDPTKNLDRAFVGFHLFLQQHPEFHGRVSLVAHVVPSRLNITVYQTYLQHTITTANEINAALSSSSWTPINLQLRDDREYAMALLRLYDVLLVNSLADGLNLVAKEGSLVNERNGVVILSYTAGVIDEVGNYTLNVEPTSEQELADSLYVALTMSKDERKCRSRGLQQAVTATNPEQWLNDQLHDLINKTSQIVYSG